MCRRTFAATRGTPFYRLQTEPVLVIVVLSLLSWGCPLQAIVVTFVLDERTVAAWLQRAGQHCRAVHQHLVQQGQVDVQHVQADELWVKLVGQRVWLAMALAAPSRLWLGGVLSPQRDRALITSLVQQVRACATNWSSSPGRLEPDHVLGFAPGTSCCGSSLADAAPAGASP